VLCARPIAPDAAVVQTACVGLTRVQLKSELRGRFRGWAGPIIVLALAAAASLTAATAARRTDTAFTRALSSANAADANVSVDAQQAGSKATKALDALERSSLVTEHARYGGAILAAVRNGRLDERYNSASATAYLPFDSRAGVTISRFRVVHGRTASPDRADEVVVNEPFLRATGNHLGDTIAGLRVFEFADSDENGIPDPSKGTPVTVRIVGVVKPPEETLAPSELRIFATTALTRRFAAASFYYQEPVRLARGTADLGRLNTLVDRLQNQFPEAEIFISSNREGLARANRATDPIVNGLWIIAGLALAVGLLLAGQSFARVLTTRADDNALYRVVGATRAQRLRAELASVLCALTIAAGLAVVIAWALSSLTPVGTARAAEPHPGLILNVGFALVTVALLLVAGVLAVVPTAVRVAYATALPGQANAPSRGRPSRAARAIGNTRLGVPAVVGTQFAFEPGRGSSATPVAGVIASLALIVTTVTATVAFGANLDRLVTTKSLYGWNWDAAVGTSFLTIPSEQQDLVLEAPGVTEMTGLAVGRMTIGKEVVPAVGIDPLRGKVEPTLNAGRLPRLGDEIALGAKTMRTTHTQLGDLIKARINDRPVQLRVVGVATIPAFGNAAFSQAGLGTGAIGRASLFPPQDPEAPGKYNYLLLGYGDSAATTAQLASLDRTVRKFGCSDPVCTITDLRPDEINGFRGARSVPLAIGIVVALLLFATLTHTVLSTMRRRQIDLAVLRALGGTRRQLESTMRWQAFMLIGSAMAVGIPLGLVANKIAWAAFTERIGVAPGTVIPLAWLAVGAASVFAVGYALATGVGRRASTYARTDPFVA
jgi:putative ABC transport system permease protein